MASGGGGRESGEIGEVTDRRKKGKRRRARAREKAAAESRDQEQQQPIAEEAEEDEEGESTDPLVVLGSDLVTKVLEFLDARSVARLLVVSRRWHDVATSDRLWAPKVLNRSTSDFDAQF